MFKVSGRMFKVPRLLSTGAFFLLLSCSTHPIEQQGAYLFPRAKQKHSVVAYGPTGTLTSRSINFLIIEEAKAKLTSLAPTSQTMMKATMYPAAPAEIHSLNPIMEKQRPIVVELLKRLSKLLWIKTGEVPSDIQVVEAFSDGSARILEWKISNQRIRIEVELL